MAQWLTTEYVDTCLQLTRVEMNKFMKIVNEHQLTMHVKVLDNGSIECVLQDEYEEEMVLSFEQKSGLFQFVGTCRMSSANLVKIMRRAVAEFKGNAIMKRVYAQYCMVYAYQQGKVVKIVEVRDHQEKVIYEQQDIRSEMEILFLRNDIEHHIQHIVQEINLLLTERSSTKDSIILTKIDAQLSVLSHRLFTLEA
jgi:hypothetical protein